MRSRCATILRSGGRFGAALVLAGLAWVPVFAQLQAPPAGAAPAGTEQQTRLASGIVSRVPDDQFAQLSFANRYIITFRASVVPRDPAERAAGARRALERLTGAGLAGPVGSRPLLGASILTVAGQDVFAILPEDVDEAADETLEQLTAATIARVQLALKEAAEARAPALLAWGLAKSLAVTVLLAVLLWLVARLYRLAVGRLMERAEARVARSRVGGATALMRATRLFDLARGLVRLAIAATVAFLIYAWLTFVLQRFPLTRPWGEALRGYLIDTVTMLALGTLHALPGLFTALLIFLAIRFVVRMLGLVFDAVQQNQIQLGTLSGAKAATTRRLVTTLLWLFAIVVAYPYLPGSNTEAFKGVSVFLGLVISLGSSGIVNQLMSGFMLTYSGALEPGEYVQVGDVEGTVTSLGVLSTKIRNKRNEEITIPNAVVISGKTVNFSRHAAAGVYVPTAVTIGYDTPWRQVEALLLIAAGRTPGLRQDRPPSVLQTSLSDFYVEYTLLVCVADPAQRLPALAALRAHIQDAFNEHGVQIMSPHYEADPEGAKLVPRDKWFAAPASAPREVETRG
jgi:small-conductance mechanosensitive channel